MFKTFKNFHPELLEEAYSEGVTIGDLKNYHSQHNNLQGFQISLTNGTAFKLSKEMLNFISSKLNEVPDSKNSAYAIAVEPNLLKYKIARDFSKTLELSKSEMMRLDSNFFGIGNGSIKTGGSNYGDISEIIFNFAIYNYILEQGHTTNFIETFKKLLHEFKMSGSSLKFSRDLEITKKIVYTVKLDLSMKNLTILDYFKDVKNNLELESNIHQILHFISTNKGIWNKIVDGIRSKTYSNGTIFSVVGNGASDSKFDRSDLKIAIVDPKVKEDHSENFSLKNNNKTLSKIVLSTLSNIATNLKCLNITLESKEETELAKAIKNVNDYKLEVNKASFSAKQRMQDILDRKGYEVASQVFLIILNHFNKSSSEDRTMNFILNPALFFVKGMDEKLHDEVFTIIDIYKAKQSIVKSKENYKSEVEMLKQEGKKLSLTKGNFSQQKNRVNNIILFYINTPFFQYRYSSRGLDTIPRFELYIEVTNLEIFNHILSNLE